MNKLKIIIFFLTTLLIVVSFAVFFLYRKIENANLIPNDPMEDSARTIREVSKVIELPEGEIPTVATIMSMEELRHQSFFARAKIGDKVLIFQESLRVILWRPSIKKIIEVSFMSAPGQNDNMIIENEQKNIDTENAQNVN